METDSSHESDFEASFSGATIEELRELARFQAKIVMRRQAAFISTGIFGLPGQEASLAAYGEAWADQVMLDSVIAKRENEARLPRLQKMVQPSAARRSKPGRT